MNSNVAAVLPCCLAVLLSFMVRWLSGSIRSYHACDLTVSGTLLNRNVAGAIRCLLLPTLTARDPNLTCKLTYCAA